MLKQALLTTLLSLSTLAAATINLDLNLVIKNQTFEHSASGKIVLNENIPASIIFNEFETLVFNFVAAQEDETASIQVQIFQTTEDDQLTEITNPITINVPFEESAIITVNEEENNEGYDTSLTLTITPSLVE